MSREGVKIWTELAQNHLFQKSQLKAMQMIFFLELHSAETTVRQWNGGGQYVHQSFQVRRKIDEAGHANQAKQSNHNCVCKRTKHEIN